MLKIQNKSFTLIEVVLIAAMIVILAIIGIAGYGRTKNKALSREAIASLKLIAAAERIYKLETNADTQLSYYGQCLNTDDCNTMLKLDLNSNNWTHAVDPVAGVGSSATATITVQGVSVPGCVYTLHSSQFTTGIDWTSKTADCP